jgi:hypothetical protein
MLIALVTIVGGSVCGPAVPRPPQDALTRSEIARANMRQVALAYALYWNYYLEQPATPDLLYPDWVASPRAFWHPGDSDQRPTTIDNSVPDAPNSAQISFFIQQPQGGWDLPFIWDTTPGNNGGLFINFLTADGVLETDPPLATPTPTARELGRQHIARFAGSLLSYSNDHMEQFPLRLRDLLDEGYLGSPRTFWNPGDSQPMPTAITSSELDGPESDQISFEYLVAGLPVYVLRSDSFVVRDNTPDNNGGEFIYLVTLDSTVETDPPAATAIPTRARLAQAHLRRFAGGFRAWAATHDGYLPPDLLTLWNEGWFAEPRTFWNPGDSDPMPQDITISVPDAPDSAMISFEYPAAGLLLNDLPEGAEIMGDNSVDNNGGYGRFVLRKFLGSISMPWEPDCPGDVDGDDDVDWHDLSLLVANFGLTEGATFEQGDINADGRVDRWDLDLLLEHYGDDCAP